MTRRLHNYAFEIAHTRRNELKAGSTSSENPPEDRTDILTELVKNTTLEDTLLADQVLTLLTAGHETTSSALIWALVSLAEDDRIQQRLRDEIRANIASPLDSDDVPKAAILDKLPLLNAVCHETLRMFPTVPFSARTAVKETRLGDIVLPIGGQVWLPIWQFNRSPHYWGDNASEFVPDRWITDGNFNNNGGAPSNYAQMTFLHGPRVCIGQGYVKARALRYVQCC
jgi:cytochrome P450